MKPIAVSAKPPSKSAASRRKTTIPSKGSPTHGAARQKIAACMAAKVIPPRHLPSTMAARETGATRTPCKKPSRRSSMIDTVEKIAVNSRISTTVPGKKYRMNPPSTPGAAKLSPKPDPISSQKTSGVASAPMMRLR